jgi:hypothetical protein
VLRTVVATSGDDETASLCDLGRCVVSLSDEESEAVTEGLQQEMDGRVS